MILNPAKLFEYLNTELIRSNVDKCITLFYGVINNNNKTLLYTLAGYYPKPIIINHIKNMPMVEDGYPIGVFRWAEYQQFMMKIEDGFAIAMYSDDHGDSDEKNLSETNNTANHLLVELSKKITMSSDKLLANDRKLFLVRG